jgi:NADH-quinone oxidoreductase subunit C
MAIEPNDPISEKIQYKFSDSILKTDIFRNQITVCVRRERLLDGMFFLKNDPDFLFDFLVDVTAIDYLNKDKSPRFHVVYNLRSMKFGKRLRIKVPVPENDCRVESVVSIWNSANWMERETFEMYGITFDHHPDMRKLLMPEAFKDFPLRKDYPLRGKGEREALLPEGS